MLIYYRYLMINNMSIYLLYMSLTFKFLTRKIVTIFLISNLRQIINSEYLSTAYDISCLNLLTLHGIDMFISLANYYILMTTKVYVDEIYMSKYCALIGISQAAIYFDNHNLPVINFTLKLLSCSCNNKIVNSF